MIEWGWPVPRPLMAGVLTHGRSYWFVVRACIYNWVHPEIDWRKPGSVMAVTPASRSSLKVMTWWLTTIVALHDECMAFSVNGIFCLLPCTCDRTRQHPHAVRAESINCPTSRSAWLMVAWWLLGIGRRRSQGVGSADIYLYCTIHLWIVSHCLISFSVLVTNPIFT